MDLVLEAPMWLLVLVTVLVTLAVAASFLAV
jgi:hypothetical protein